MNSFYNPLLFELIYFSENKLDPLSKIFHFKAFVRFFTVILLNFQLKQKIRNICFMNSSSFLISDINLHNRLLHVQNSALISI